MAIERQFSHKVYFRTQLEYENVKAFAARSGAGNVSSWIRDLVLAEMRRLGAVVDFNSPKEKDSADTSNDVIPNFIMSKELGHMIPVDSPEAMEILAKPEAPPMTLGAALKGIDSTIAEYIDEEEED